MNWAISFSVFYIPTVIVISWPIGGGGGGSCSYIVVLTAPSVGSAGFGDCIGLKCSDNLSHLV